MNENMNTNCFKEAVCIDAGRVYDSCCDKDCLEDLRVYFTECCQNVIENAISVRGRSAEVITVLVDVEPIPFNKGFYSVDMTFFFEVCVDVYCAPGSGSTTLTGLAMFNKKVVLYGSEGSVKIFSSELNVKGDDRQFKPVRNVPKASVQVAEPILLSARLGNECECSANFSCYLPDCISHRFDSELVMNGSNRVLLVTIGLFTIVQIERNVQMLIPVYDFCIPCKECVTSSDNPCDLFKKIQFPTDQFFPPRSEELLGESKDCRQNRTGKARCANA